MPPAGEDVAPKAATPPRVVSLPKKSEPTAPNLNPTRLAAPEQLAVAPASDPSATEAAWPGDQAEAVYLSEARERGDLPAPPASEKVSPETAVEADVLEAPLPALAELVPKISPEIRQTLEELFRAKFVAVKRIPKKNLKG